MANTAGIPVGLLSGAPHCIGAGDVSAGFRPEFHGNFRPGQTGQVVNFLFAIVEGAVLLGNVFLKYGADNVLSESSYSTRPKPFSLRHAGISSCTLLPCIPATTTSVAISSLPAGEVRPGSVNS